MEVLTYVIPIAIFALLWMALFRYVDAAPRGSAAWQKRSLA